ncbi:MAG: hypothetical protein ACOYI3_06020 [Christensenellales bacterium]|jgi:hypothetical protein
MEYLIGAILGGAIALLGAFIGKSLPEKNLPLPAFNEEPLPEHGSSEDLLRQWNNLLRYCGKEQHDDI